MERVSLFCPRHFQKNICAQQAQKLEQSPQLQNLHSEKGIERFSLQIQQALDTI